MGTAGLMVRLGRKGGRLIDEDVIELEAEVAGWLGGCCDRRLVLARP